MIFNHWRQIDSDYRRWTVIGREKQSNFRSDIVDYNWLKGTKWIQQQHNLTRCQPAREWQLISLN